MKIGFDFGSTYSTLARYDEGMDLVESLILGEGEPASIPSVVSISSRNNKIKVTCGRAAKEHIGAPNRKMFEAFKMLLPVSDMDMLRSHGYSESYMPSTITKMFISSVIRNALERYHEDMVQNLVICIPEIWDRKKGTINGRNNLLSVLEEISEEEKTIKKENIKIINEPEAASAYIAYNLEKANKSRGIETGFNGHLLLIDYGGGTLDLTLTEVISKGDGVMEITVSEDGGDGENHYDKNGKNEIGCAGIAYMQNVVISSMRKQGFLEENEAPDYSSPVFLGAVKLLESELKNLDRIKDIENAFAFSSSYRECEEICDEPDEDDEFTSVPYLDDEIIIYYKQLFLSYRDVIEPVLAREIRLINEKTGTIIKSNPCAPDAGKNNDFKIAIVGGFGNFYFVKKQLSDIYNLDVNMDIDPRITGITDDRREQAISLGAALIAAGKVQLKRTAKYSIGLYTTKTGTDEIQEFFYGIKFRQEIIPDMPYFIRNKDGKVATWACLNQNINKLAIEFSGRENCGGLLDLKPKMIERLNSLPSKGFWQCAFSMDNNEVISMIFVEKPLNSTDAPQETIRIVLDNYEKMFNLTNIREVTL